MPDKKMTKKITSIKRKRDPNKFTRNYNAATGITHEFVQDDAGNSVTPGYDPEKASQYKANAITKYGSLEASRKAYGNPNMAHKPKMAHGDKPQFNDKLKADAKAGKLDKSPEFKEMVLRAKMAMPKMVDGKNFPKMAQDMAKVLVQKMPDAKMYKPTKYHDGPKMGHEPKMYGENKK